MGKWWSSPATASGAYNYMLRIALHKHRTKYLPVGHNNKELLGTLGLLGIVIIGNFGQVFFLLGITDEKCH